MKRRHKILISLLSLSLVAAPLLSVESTSFKRASAGTVASDWTSYNAESITNVTDGINVVHKTGTYISYCYSTNAIKLDGLSFNLTFMNPHPSDKSFIGFYFGDKNSTVFWNTAGAQCFVHNMTCNVYDPSTSNTQTRLHFGSSHNYGLEQYIYLNPECTQKMSTPASSATQIVVRGWRTDDNGASMYTGGTYSFYKISSTAYKMTIQPNKPESTNGWRNEGYDSSTNTFTYYIKNENLPLDSNGMMRLFLWADTNNDVHASVNITNFGSSYASGISFDSNKYYIYDTYDLSVSVSGAGSMKVDWSSADTSIATVKGTTNTAKVTVNKAGTTTITASVHIDATKTIQTQTTIYCYKSNSKFKTVVQASGATKNGSYDGPSQTYTNLINGYNGESVTSSKVTLDGLELKMKLSHVAGQHAHNYIYFSNNDTQLNNLKVINGTNSAIFTFQNGNAITASCANQTRIYCTTFVYNYTHEANPFDVITALKEGGELTKISSGDGIVGCVDDNVKSDTDLDWNKPGTPRSYDYYHVKFEHTSMGWWKITIDDELTKHFWDTRRGENKCITTDEDGVSTAVFYVPNQYFDVDSNGQTYLHFGSNNFVESTLRVEQIASVEITTLNQGTNKNINLTLKTPVTSGTDGSGTIAEFSKKATINTQPTIGSKSTLEGYYADPYGNTKVLNSDGSTCSNVDGYTYSDGRWGRLEDTTLYAVLQKTQDCDITYETNGGTLFGYYSSKVKTTDTGDVNIPRDVYKENYRFDCWCLDPELTYKIYPLRADEVNSDITLYARYYEYGSDSNDSYTTTNGFKSGEVIYVDINNIGIENDGAYIKIDIWDSNGHWYDKLPISKQAGTGSGKIYAFVLPKINNEDVTFTACRVRRLGNGDEHWNETYDISLADLRNDYKNCIHLDSYVSGTKFINYSFSEFNFYGIESGDSLYLSASMWDLGVEVFIVNFYHNNAIEKASFVKMEKVEGTLGDVSMWEIVAPQCDGINVVWNNFEIVRAKNTIRDYSKCYEGTYFCNRSQEQTYSANIIQWNVLEISDWNSGALISDSYTNDERANDYGKFICTRADGSCDPQGYSNIKTLKTDWADYKTQYNQMNKMAQGRFWLATANPDGTYLEHSASIYDYIYGKYSPVSPSEFEDFANRTPSVRAMGFTFSLIDSITQADSMTIVVIVGSMTLALFSYFILRRRKQD